MDERYSRPVEEWTEPDRRVDVLIVGSGYGGSVAAYRLAHPTDRTVVVLERGREYQPGDFPAGLGDVPGHVQFRRPNDLQSIGYADGLYDVRFGDHVDVLVGSGLGGTSLINANVAMEPAPEAFSLPGWPAAIAAEATESESGFRRSFGFIRELIGTAPGPLTAKHRALKTLATSLNASCEAADITVSLADRVNAAGIAQAACTLCGNCVTGCNVGAKNTLAMTLIPLAKQRGARFFTGALVTSVEPAGGSEFPWLVRYRRTATVKKPLAAETFTVRAKVVVLAAGTLGSTEILLRAKERGTLALSNELGKHFSTNGDALAAGYAQKTAVDAMGKSPQAANWAVGPTICGVAKICATDPDSGASVPLTIEDGAIPVALHHLFGELITTGAQAARLVNPALPGWYGTVAAATADPIAVHADAMDHTQVLLIMGDDGAGGRMELVGTKDALGNDTDGHLKVRWEAAGRNPALRAADALLAGEDRSAGFDGGQYVANPLWKILPDEAATVMNGALPGGRVVTVHPLGGCAMADDAEHGVVDANCNVYAPGAPSGRHQGLYVIDGAVVPRALGVNPFLTISAIAWRACDKLLEEMRWGEAPPSPSMTINLVPTSPKAPQPAVKRFESPMRRIASAGVLASVLSPWLQRPGIVSRFKSSGWSSPDQRTVHRAIGSEPIERNVEIELKELLVGELDVPPSSDVFGASASRLAEYRGLVLHVTMPMPSVERWYSNPGEETLTARARLYAHPLSADRVRALHACELHDADLNKLTPLVMLEGRVQLFGRVPCTRATLNARAFLAFAAYALRRRGSGSWWKDMFDAKRRRAFWNVALNHADYRVMRYDFRGVAGVYDVILRGKKLLAWRPLHRHLWDALMTLPITLETACGADRQTIPGTLNVNMEYMATDGLAQVRSTPHLPATVSAMSGIGMYFVRALLQTSFWEFGAPGYGEVRQNLDWPRLKIPGQGEVVPQVVSRDVPIAEPRGPAVKIWLSRYAQAGRKATGAQPVLLIHGLAQGSLIYSTSTTTWNMAAYLWSRGYDVWLVDYRLSNRILPGLASEAWSMEEIARHDISTAVRHVHEVTGKPVHVFAHCVGATTLTMAVLKRWLDSSMLGCVAFNAIHPWVLTSPVNRFRSSLGAFLRDAVGRDLLDPIPRANPSPAQVVLDRLAFSLGRYNKDGKQGHSPFFGDELPQAICDRMTFLYGRMWRHENLDPRLHDGFVDMLGPAPGSVYRHLYYFSRLGRVTDRDGQNIFLTESNITANWTFDTMFFHGESSEVFNPQSATRSAVRLRQILDGAGRDDQRVWLRRVPGYGHMDVVFAKDAHERVFPLLEAFFRGETDAAQYGADRYEPSDDVDYAAPVDLTSGPVLRAAWVEQGRVRVRVWGELHDDATSPVVALEAAGSGAREIAEYRVDHSEERYRLIDLELNPEAGPATMPVRGKVASGTTWPSGEKGVYLQQVFAALSTASGDDDARIAIGGSWVERLRSRAQGRAIAESHFLVGSCRYPGTMFERDQADAAFGGMLRHLADDDRSGLPGVDMLFLVGDQIYADATAGLADSKSWRERYSAQYRRALCGPRMKTVLASVPTHFAVDDHELWDDVSGLPQPGDSLPVDPDADEAMRNAKRAATCFLSAARDRYPIAGQAAPSSPFWYPLDSAESACPMFVMDTRTERELRYAVGGERARLIGDAQWQAVQQWLKRGDPKRPKFLFCGAVVAPLSKAYASCPAAFRNEDGWLGYPESFARLARFIVDEGIENLVIVAGDLHFSAVTKLDIEYDSRTATVWHVVSSGLYAPMPFANAHSADMVLSGPIPVFGHGEISMRASGAVLCEGVSHFARFDAHEEEVGGRWELCISAHDASGGNVTLPRPPGGATMQAGAWVIMLEKETRRQPAFE